MGRALIRGICAVACALACHATLVTGAAYLGWFSSDGATLPELDLTSVDLSFSETPDETAAPAALPPPPPAEPQPPTPPPPPVSESTPPPPTIEFPQLPSVNPPPPPIIEHTFQPDLDSLLADEPQKKQAPQKTEPESSQPDPQEKQPHVQSAPTSAPTPAPSQARVAVDKPPSPHRRIKPEYPKGARQRGEEGDVTLELDISANGTVDGVRIVASCGFAELEQAAVQAVKRARFTPARRGSANVPATVRLTLTFRLKD